MDELQVKAAYEKNVKRAHDDSSHDEKYGLTNTEEVHRFEQYFAEFDVGRFVEFYKYERTYTAEVIRFEEYYT